MSKLETLPTVNAIEIPISICSSTAGFDQALTFGVPFPQGLVDSSMKWGLRMLDGRAIQIQHRATGHWPDGSIKWLKITFISQHLANAQDRQPILKKAVLYQLGTNADPAPTPESRVLRLSQTTSSMSIDTGSAVFRFSPGKTLLECPQFFGNHVINESDCRVVCRDANGRRQVAIWEKNEVVESGPLQTTISSTGRLGQTGLRIEASLSFHAGSNLIRAQISTTNPRRAKHAGGYWDLGDPGSILLQSLTLELNAPAMPKRTVYWRENSQTLTRASLRTNLEIYQDSSGGSNWNSCNHVNRVGEIPLSFCGYRVRYGNGDRNDKERCGRRASPFVAIVEKERYIACALEEFWQKFPSALEVCDNKVLVHLLPGQFGDLHELQGGERNSRVAWMDFGFESDNPWRKLSSVYDPPVVIVDSAWIAGTKAIPFLPKSDNTQRSELRSLLDGAIDGPFGFFAKREKVDEYGWRHFGDTWADHEQAHSEDASPVVSHYNNQYDMLNGWLIQFLQTGDIRWWRLADALARHAIDIDIYHTKEDKSAYSGGMFWHTAHYHAACTSSHRCYSQKMRGKEIPVSGGGPSNEHNYTSGLLLYFQLTGNLNAREAVIGLGDWVIAMDDSRQNPLGVFSRASTGLASKTRDASYHGPGRGAGNSILTLANAWLASGDKIYVDKASELIRRTIHPRDDLANLRLLDTEERWSYTVFLQVLFFFLELVDKVDDCQYIRAYAKVSILLYARWMLEHEQLNLDRPEELEYPTETWAAQDLRKGVVLLMAASLTDNSTESNSLFVKGNKILDDAWDSLMSFPTRNCTRPIAIVLQQGYLERYFGNGGHCWAPDEIGAPTPDFGSPLVFVPQKKLVFEQAKSPVRVFSLVLRLAYPGSWPRLMSRSWAASCIRNKIGMRELS